MASNPYVNKVQWADGTPIIDLSDATATADKIMQGFTAYGATGQKLTGTASGGGTQAGTVWQDVNGLIHLDKQAGVSGLEYETGTFSPEEDVYHPTINFKKTHSELPILAAISDVTGIDDFTTNTNWVCVVFNANLAFGVPIPYDGSGVRYGTAFYMYRATNTASLSLGGQGISYSEESSTSSTSGYMRYWLTESSFKPYSASTTRYWRAGRTYKWIAVWKPTT